MEDERVPIARILIYDEAAQLWLMWSGGHGVHAYDWNDKEVAYWNTGDFEFNDASEEDVLESMNDRINQQDYVDFC